MEKKSRLPPINKVGPSDDELDKDTGDTFDDVEDLDHGEFVMPSLPMKFSFNRLYVAPSNFDPSMLEKVDLSLKAIFSKDANAVQKKARNNFLFKVFAIALAFVIVLSVIIAVALTTGGTTVVKEESGSTEAPVVDGPLTKIETALVNDLVEIDPARIASSSLDGFVNVWNVYTGKNLQRWKAHASPTKIVCTAKGYIVTGSLDANDALKLWNPNTSVLIDTGAFSSSITALTIIDNSTATTRIATGQSFSTITFWDLTNDAITEVLTLQSSSGDIFKLLLLSDGRLAAGCANGDINIWDVTTSTLFGTYDGSTINDPVKALAELSPIVLSAGSNGEEISIWDLRRSVSAQIGSYMDVGAEILSMVSLSNSTYAYGTTEKIGLVKYTITPGFGSATIAQQVNRTLSGHEAAINALILINDGRLVSGSSDGSIRFWWQPGGFTNPDIYTGATVYYDSS